jgi:hypothetical protein
VCVNVCSKGEQVRGEHVCVYRCVCIGEEVAEIVGGFRCIEALSY